MARFSEPCFSAVTRDQVDAVIRSRLLPEKLHLVVAGDLDSIPQ